MAMAICVFKLIILSSHPHLATSAGETSQEVVEEHQQLVWWREDLVLLGSRLRPPLLQTHPTLRHGRDRRRPRLQERLHRGQLCQGEDQERAIHNHIPEVRFLSFGRFRPCLFSRSNMFELADRLVGIYKTHDCTKSVTINPGDHYYCSCPKCSSRHYEVAWKPKHSLKLIHLGLVESLPPPPSISSPAKSLAMPGLPARTPSLSSVASTNGPTQVGTSKLSQS